MFLGPVDDLEVIRTVQNCLLKKVICNVSFQTCVFPNKMKIGAFHIKSIKNTVKFT